MEFENRLSESAKPEEIIEDLSIGPTGEYDLGILFLSLMSLAEVQDIVEGLRQNISIRDLLVTTCSGVIGSEIELEDQSAASFMLAKLPGVNISPFYLDQAQLKQMPEPADWQQFFNVFPNENPAFILLPDPFLLDINHFLKGMNAAYPGCPIAGGLASGADQPTGNTLMLGDSFYEQGMVGVVLTGAIEINTVVSQGCRPIGETYLVTRAERNVIFELGGRPFTEVLEEVVANADARDQELLRQSIFVGIAIDEKKSEYKPGDFLIRGLMRLDPESGTGSIGDEIDSGQRIQFHVRDPQSAVEELHALLEHQQKSMQNRKPEGALVFSCSGRGEHLFARRNHDIDTIQQHLGPVPASGLFCAGEIGCVGDQSFLHGFTNSMVLFYSPLSEE